MRYAPPAPLLASKAVPSRSVTSTRAPSRGRPWGSRTVPRTWPGGRGRRPPCMRCGQPGAEPRPPLPEAVLQGVAQGPHPHVVRERQPGQEGQEQRQQEQRGPAGAPARARAALPSPLLFADAAPIPAVPSPLSLEDTRLCGPALPLNPGYTLLPDGLPSPGRDRRPRPQALPRLLDVRHPHRRGGEQAHRPRRAGPGADLPGHVQPLRA